MTSESNPPSASERSEPSEPSLLARELGRRGGKRGGKRSLETMSQEQRSARARRAARSRWGDREAAAAAAAAQSRAECAAVGGPAACEAGAPPHVAVAGLASEASPASPLELAAINMAVTLLAASLRDASRWLSEGDRHLAALAAMGEALRTQPPAAAPAVTVTPAYATSLTEAIVASQRARGALAQAILTMGCPRPEWA